MNQRIGLAIAPRSLTVRGSVSPCSQNVVEVPDAEQPGAPNPNVSQQRFMRTTYRLLVIRDREGSAPNPDWRWSDVFECSGDVNAASPNNFLRVQNSFRFQICGDRRFVVDLDDPVKEFNIPVSIRNTQLRYSGADPYDIRSGHYYILCIAEVIGIRFDASLLVDRPSTNFSVRMTYTDS